jgi:hypothetical protein
MVHDAIAYAPYKYGFINQTYTPYELWGSFWGASNDELSLTSLKTVIELTSLEKLPKIEIYHSQFCDMHGWGNKISRDDYERWRSTW